MPKYTYHCFNCTQWVDEIGGYEKLNEKLLKQKKGEKLPTFIPPKVFNFQQVMSVIQFGDSFSSTVKLVLSSTLKNRLVLLLTP
jgi:hypothetical protein